MIERVKNRKISLLILISISVLFAVMGFVLSQAPTAKADSNSVGTVYTQSTTSEEEKDEIIPDIIVEENSFDFWETTGKVAPILSIAASGLTIYIVAKKIKK